MAHGLLKTAVVLHVLYDPMRPPLTARDRVSVCIELIPQSKHARDLRERRLLRIAYKHAANAEKSSFLRCFGDILADFTEPALEGGRIVRRLAVNQRPRLPQGLDALGLELGGVPACELFPQAISGDALPLRGLLRRREMDSNYWYRGTKAVDFRSIPGIWGYRRGS